MSTVIKTDAKVFFGIEKNTNELLLYNIYISLESTYSLQVIIEGVSQNLWMGYISKQA